MGMWSWVLIACLVGFITKLVGYLLPSHWLEQPRVSALFGAMTIGLLSSLVVLNAIGSGQHLVLDARIVALVVAGIALWRRAPYLVVVLLGAAAAALARLAGMA